jgi:hypothetical protein
LPACSREFSARASSGGIAYLTVDRDPACGIMPVVASATDRLAAIDPSSRVTHSCSRTIEAQGATMRLLLAYIICLLVGQSLTIGFGLLVERYSTPYTGLASFIVSYFAMFWIAWRLAVRITEPRSRLAVHTAKR